MDIKENVIKLSGILLLKNIDNMKLGRCEDKEYMLNLIANLVSL